MESNFINLWFLSYFLPAMGALLFIVAKRKWGRGKIRELQDVLFMHLALAVSIFLVHGYINKLDLVFPWYPSILSLTLLFFSVILATILLGRFGFYYSLSAIEQQLTIVSITFLLVSFLNIVWVALLVAPVYSVAHMLALEKWKLRIGLTMVWGIASSFLFYKTGDMYLNMALHTTFGAFLISKNVLYVKNPRIK